MALCVPKRGGIPYSPIWDEDDLVHHRRRQSQRRWLIAFAFAVTAVILLFQSSSSSSLPFHPFGFGKPPPHKHSNPKQHLLPTILYVVDPLTGNYLNAVYNPLYEQLKGANFIKDDVVNIDTSILPQLNVDRTAYHPQEPLTLSWNNNSTDESHIQVKDEDLILLHCGSGHGEFESSRFLEAATVAHAKATSRKHGGIVEHEWYIPSFPIAQHRACQFSLYRQLQQQQTQDSVSTTFQLLTKSPMISVHGPETPTAIHLAFTSDPTEMTVHFTTFVEGVPMVIFWSANDDARNPMTTIVDGHSRTYTADDMCQAPANLTEAGKFQSPGYLHQVILTHLEPDTIYYYKVRISTDINHLEWTGPFTFSSSPRRGDTKPFTYLVYGDQGVITDTFGDQGQWTAAMVARETNPNNSNNNNNNNNKTLVAIHHFGDLSYAMGAAHVWDDWFHQISSFSPHVPLMISVGNHEYDHTDGGDNGKDPSNVTDSHGYMPRWGNFGDDSGGECGVPTAARFSMPTSKGSNGVFWYSFDMASVHTIVLSSEHDLFPNSPQHTWLLSDLKSVNRTVTPWLVVELHRPLYEAEPSVANNMVGIFLRHAIEDLLVQYKVDIVLAGHYHAYHRTCDGLYRGKCHMGGPMHITVGSAGATLDPELPLFPVRWTESFIARQFGYGRITVHNSTVMRFDFVKAGPESDASAGEIHDTAWIVRKR